MCTQQPPVKAQPGRGALDLAYMLRDTLDEFITMEEARVASEIKQILPLARLISESAQQRQADSAPRPSVGPR